MITYIFYVANGLHFHMLEKKYATIIGQNGIHVEYF